MKQVNLGNYKNDSSNKKFTDSSNSTIFGDHKSNVAAKKSGNKVESLSAKRIRLDNDKNQKSSKLNKLLLLFILFFLILALSMFLYLKNPFGSINAAYSQIHKVFNDCAEGNCQIVELDKPTCSGIFCNARELPRTNGKTNILLLGVDSRGANQGDSSGGLTDTIIVASYDHDTNYLNLISIPRDTQVTYTNVYGNKETSKINQVYYNSGWIKKDYEMGINGVSQEVTKITGLPIHYSALITLDGFKELIDAIGGIDITVEKDIKNVYPPTELSAEYKKNNCKNVLLADGYYCEWSLRAGNHSMNGEEALVYARSREYTTDWDRSRRQQQVIDAIRSKILSSSILLNPQKLSDIVTSLQNNIKISSYDANDLLAGLRLKDKYNGMVSIVLDPTFMPENITPVEGTSDFKIKNYNDLQKKLQTIFQNPAIYKENATVFEYFTGYEVNLPLNLSEVILKNTSASLNIVKVPAIVGLNQTFAWNSIVDEQYMRIGTESLDNTDDTRHPYFYDFTNGEKSETKKVLEKSGVFEIKLVEGTNIKRYNDEDFAIIWR